MSVFPGITASDIAQMADGSLIVGSGVGTFTVTASPELRELTITAAAADKVPLIIEGASSQTANLMEWNPAGVTPGTRARVNSAGEFVNDVGVTNCVAYGNSITIGASGSSTVVGRNITIGSNVQKPIMIGQDLTEVAQSLVL